MELNDKLKVDYMCNEIKNLPFKEKMEMFNVICNDVLGDLIVQNVKELTQDFSPNQLTNLLNFISFVKANSVKQENEQNG